MRVLVVSIVLATVACSAKPPAESRVHEEREACVFASLAREEHKIPSLTSGIELFVLRVGAFGARRGAALLTHGAGSPSSASWDLAHGEYSLMRHLACAGFDAYGVDLRGFGGSTSPAAMGRPAEDNAPAVRAAEAMPDVEAAVAFAARTSSVDKVDLFGWSWGCDVAGLFASTRPERVRRLVLFAPVYDRRWPERHVTKNAWRIEKRDVFLQFFDETTEERAVLDEFIRGMFRFTEGEELRLPNGPYRDLYGEDAPVWDPRGVQAPTLVVRGELDRASLEPHAYALFSDLTRAPLKRYLVLGGADHFVFRKKGYAALHRAVSSFLLEP